MLKVNDLLGCLVRSKFPIGDPLKDDWERLAAEVNKLLVPAPAGSNARRQVEKWKRRTWEETVDPNRVVATMVAEIEQAFAADANESSGQ